jgi:translation elongation factor EF-Tu-like GTPase
MAARTLNVNVGILGHVDSGKTTIGEIWGSHSCEDSHDSIREEL